jgi:pilus assembly protein CpaB
MDAKKVALLVAALVVAAGTAFLARSMFMKGAAPESQAAVAMGPEILVATRALPVGTIIEPDSFRYAPWPKELVENAYFTKGEADPSSLAGTVVRSPVTAGQPLTQGALVKPGDRGFLAAALGPGMRAVTVSVSAQSGVAGFVFPGDRIDMVLTQQVTGGSGPPLRTSETIVRNIRVLATDQRTVTEDEEGKKVVQTFSNVTLEVTPRIAEKIAVAQAVGQLSLSLRSIADNTAELERAIASGEVKMPANGDPKAEKSVLLSVASRPIDTDTTFVTGGDVSRFQRRTVPKMQASGGEDGESSTRRAARAAAPAPAPYVRPGEEKPFVYTGPVVRVTRGSNKDAEVVRVGGK